MLVTLLLSFSISHAAVQTYTGVGEYTMSEFETIDIAKERAKLYAERNAQEQAGFFVQSSSTVKNSKLTKDEINTVTCGIISVIETSYKTLSDDDSKNVTVQATVKANIDSDEINKWFDKDIQKRSILLVQNRELKKAIDKQEKTILNLKKQISKVKTKKDKENLAKKYSEADKQFLSNHKIEEGNKFYVDGNFMNALSCYDEAINLDPNNYLAYSNRSVIFLDNSAFDKTIQDCDKAVKLNPDFVLSYYNRAVAYQGKQDFEKSIADYKKTLELDPNFAAVYNNLGLICYAAQEFDTAMNVFNKGIEISPDFPELYNNRNLVYVALKDFNRALEDCNKAIQLKPDYAEAWYNRGNIYYYLNNYQQALKNYNKALELNPNFSQASYNRDVVRGLINN